MTVMATTTSISFRDSRLRIQVSETSEKVLEKGTIGLTLNHHTGRHDLRPLVRLGLGIGDPCVGSTTSLYKETDEIGEDEEDGKGFWGE